MNMTFSASEASRQGGFAAAIKSPLFLLGLAIVAVCVLLALPLAAPIGPMYWDVFIYYDAANRIFDGQVPANDFFTPVGPLGYYLFAGWLWLFPNAQPTLIAHWSLLAATAPLMALVLWDVGKRSRRLGFALLVPFLVFALLPFNTREFYPFPGSDAFGIYNRQVCQVLYVLVAALVFVCNRHLLVILITLSMTALFFLKITGFAAGGVIALFAFLAGRVQFRHAFASALSFLAIIGALQLYNGIVGTYLADILRLVDKNAGTLLPRFLQAASINFGAVLATASLALLLLWSDRREIAAQFAAQRKTSTISALSDLLDHHGFWLLAVLFAGILFETQNTGSQAFIFLWPAVLAALAARIRPGAGSPLQLGIVVLAAATIVPAALSVTERAARAYIGAVKNERLKQRNLGPLGAVNMRSEVAVRVDHMQRFYPAHRSLYEDLTAADELATPMLYSDYDFQIGYLISVDDAIDAIRKLESDKGVHFETLMSLNFVNPFPWLMNRSAPLQIAIGADPMRAVPDLTPDEAKAVSATDLVLLPTCPPTTANAMLYDHYKDALTQHRRIRLDDCYDAFVNPKFLGVLDK